MKKFANVQSVKLEIDAYEKHFTGAPLLIGVDSSSDYMSLLGMLRDDYGKQIMRMSDVCSMDFPPDPAFQLSQVGKEAKSKPVIWLGAAQAKMLYGQQATERFLINLLGTSFSGPVTVLCPFCCNILEGIGRNFTKLGYNIIVVNSDDRVIPVIHVSSEHTSSVAGDSVHGIKALLRILEDGKHHHDNRQSLRQQADLPVFRSAAVRYRDLQVSRE